MLVCCRQGLQPLRRPETASSGGRGGRSAPVGYQAIDHVWIGLHILLNLLQQVRRAPTLFCSAKERGGVPTSVADRRGAAPLAYCRPVGSSGPDPHLLGDVSEDEDCAVHGVSQRTGHHQLVLSCLRAKAAGRRAGRLAPGPSLAVLARLPPVPRAASCSAPSCWRRQGGRTGMAPACLGCQRRTSIGGRGRRAAPR